MPRRRLLPILLVTLLATLLAPASSGAYVVGIGDHNPAVFANEHLTQFGVERVRYITPYDSVLKDRATVDVWMDAARAAGMEVLVAFNPPSTMKCPNLNGARGCKPVTGARFKQAFRAFHKRYPWVRHVQPWNEVNNLTQPTAHHPEAVVAYYKIVRQVCRSCTVLGADIQDLPNMVPYTQRLLEIFKARKVRVPRVWGMHNYSDVNRFIKDKNSNMRKAVKLLPGKIWLTETGGLFRFQPQNARQSFRPDLARQKRAMEALFKQANRYRNKIARVYLYHWFGAPVTNRWDSGVLDIHGRPRPAYAVLERYRHLFR